MEIELINNTRYCSEFKKKIIYMKIELINETFFCEVSENCINF